MQLALFSTFISLALAAGPVPFSVNDPQGDPNRLIPPIPPCVECTATCAAIFAACALFCAVPGDPFCEVNLPFIASSNPIAGPIPRT